MAVAVRWEYATLRWDDFKETWRWGHQETTFERMGDDGWELVNVWEGRAFFKRPKGVL